MTVDWAAKLAAAAAETLDAKPAGAAESRPSHERAAASSQERKASAAAGAPSPGVHTEDLDRPCSWAASPDGGGPGDPRVAIAVCMRGCPAPRLREWLFWHLSEGVRPIFLRWEGPLDEQQRLALRGPSQRGEVVLTRVAGARQSSSFQSVMCRQIRFAQAAIADARKRGCDFLLHLDDDELLCPRSEDLSIPALFRRHVGSGARCIHFENLEAVFPFDESTDRPFSRPGTRFRTHSHALYCNGKSAANLRAPGDIFCSGVHHFCQYDRSFEPPLPEYGLHDDGSGCTHPSCCRNDAAAVVLHFDSPSFEEWHAKFSARARSKFSEQDEEEMKIFPFKRESVKTLQRANSSARMQRRVYSRWRCLPGLPRDSFDPRLTGQTVAARLLSRLASAREHAARGC